MKMNFKKGFTLIELLVVVAIIGILASVVLASLNSARAKGSDAAIKANLSGLRANAELQYDTMGGCYASGGTCASGAPAVYPEADCATTIANSIFGLTSIAQQLSGAKSAGLGLTSCSATVGGTSWAAAVQYKSSTTKAWCVDSLGTSKEVTIATTNDQSAIDGAITTTSTSAVCI